MDIIEGVATFLGYFVMATVTAALTNSSHRQSLWIVLKLAFTVIRNHPWLKRWIGPAEKKHFWGSSPSPQKMHMSPPTQSIADTDTDTEDTGSEDETQTESQSSSDNAELMSMSHEQAEEILLYRNVRESS